MHAEIFYIHVSVNAGLHVSISAPMASVTHSSSHTAPEKFRESTPMVFSTTTTLKSQIRGITFCLSIDGKTILYYWTIASADLPRRALSCEKVPHQTVLQYTHTAARNAVIFGVRVELAPFVPVVKQKPSRKIFTPPAPDCPYYTQNS